MAAPTYLFDIVIDNIQPGAIVIEPVGSTVNGNHIPGQKPLAVCVVHQQETALAAAAFCNLTHRDTVAAFSDEHFTRNPDALSLSENGLSDNINRYWSM